MWESVWGECGGFEKVCWGVGGGKRRCRERCGKVYVVSVGKCAGAWREVREIWGEVWGSVEGGVGKSVGFGGR